MDRKEKTTQLFMELEKEQDPEKKRAIQNEIIKINQKLIHPVIYAYSRDLSQDLYAVCLEGLFKATKAYRPEKGIEFSTFATAVMKNEVRMHIKFFVGRGGRLWTKIQQTKEEIIAEGVEPTREMVCRRLGISEWLYASCEQPISMETKIFSGGEDQEQTIADRLESADPSPDMVALNREEKEVLYEAIDSLKAFRKLVLVEYYFGGKKQKQIAAEQGVSRTYVSRILAVAVEELKQKMSDYHQR